MAIFLIRALCMFLTLAAIFEMSSAATCSDCVVTSGSSSCSEFNSYLSCLEANCDPATYGTSITAAKDYLKTYCSGSVKAMSSWGVIIVLTAVTYFFKKITI